MKSRVGCFGWDRFVLCLLATASPSYAEKAKQPVHHQRETVLFSSTITETKRESLPIDERSRHEIYSRDADVLGSGSGEDTALTPTTTFIPSIYIELTLRIAPDDYEKDRETIDEKVVEVVQDYQTVPRKRAAVEDRNVELQHDSEKSKESETVLRMLVTDNESGEQNVEATAELYRALDSDRETVYALIKNATQIEVVDMTFTGDDLSARPPLKNSSLKWWDILMISLGCAAAGACPLLLVLAVRELL